MLTPRVMDMKLHEHDKQPFAASGWLETSYAQGRGRGLYKGLGGGWARLLIKLPVLWPAAGISCSLRWPQSGAGKGTGLPNAETPGNVEFSTPMAQVSTQKQTGCDSTSAEQVTLKTFPEQRGTDY